MKLQQPTECKVLNPAGASRKMRRISNDNKSLLLVRRLLYIYKTVIKENKTQMEKTEILEIVEDV